MKRTLLDHLLAWKSKKIRKPLLIDGARQTGKTFLLQELLGKTFENVLRIDFLENPEFMDAFSGSLSPDDIITNIELLTGNVFNPSTDLLILDEIGECPRAVTALKYFAEKAPEAYVAASGFNIGLLTSFPVGKVEQHNLRPLTFKEFVWASGENALLNAFERQLNAPAAHTKLFDLLTDYYFVGGMPEAVRSWFERSELSVIERLEAVSEVHKNLIEGYMRDFGKYSGKIDAQLIESVFRSIPAQLSSVYDDSVKRFKFKGVHERKSRYAEYESAIAWLHKCRLALKNHPIEGQPRTPMAAYQKENTVKLFLFDVGLLNHMLGTGYREIKQQGYEYKGYVAENYVQQEITALGIEPSFSWGDARAKIEFIVTDDLGRVIPVEVKSGKRTRAKSLQSYIEKCCPHKTIKLTGTQGSPATETKHIVMPLYYTEYLPKHLKGSNE
ncbi:MULTISPECIES: ATP-binding protein [unclassified Vibrio]|jgi:predicted AAA+ superfamily ATPase|uniref:ATP-binding protein n=1 Tax=unclassified Vibrio TaxID=2614977 RepID=UPI001F2D7BDB|nr:MULTISPECIES: ATP-binding protein [unclassified Vibrio]QXL80185.1 ATP-binding protein [Vibrio sp.]